MSGWTDEQQLDMLDRFHTGETAARIAESYGCTRNVILSLVKRTRDNAVLDGPNLKPENMDGGMPFGWWRNAR